MLGSFWTESIAVKKPTCLWAFIVSRIPKDHVWAFLWVWVYNRLWLDQLLWLDIVRDSTQGKIQTVVTRGSLPGIVLFNLYGK